CHGPAVMKPPLATLLSVLVEPLPVEPLPEPVVPPPAVPPPPPSSPQPAMKHAVDATRMAEIVLKKLLIVCLRGARGSHNRREVSSTLRRVVVLRSEAAYQFGPLVFGTGEK